MGLGKENGDKSLSRQQSWSTLWKSGRARSRADERGPESSGSLTLVCSHLRSVFKYRFLAPVPQHSGSESWAVAQECAF